jgi:DNA-binding response OmpR family regulator
MLVLSLDDDSDITQLLNSFFKKMNIKFKGVSTPKEFFDEYTNRVPDIILLDINLDTKYGAGFNLLEMLQAKLRFKGKVVMISSRSNEEDVQRAIDSGATDYLFKPFDEVGLINKLNSFMQLDTDIKLPFFKVEDKYQVCSIEIDKEIVEISEEYLVIESSELFKRENYYCIESDVFNECFGKNTIELQLYNTEKKDNIYFNKFSFESLTSEERFSLYRWLSINI